MSLVVPAGHSHGTIPREARRESPGELERAFRELPSQRLELAMDGEYCHTIRKSLSGITMTVQEAHSLLLAETGNSEAGLFLSAVYACVPDKVLVYDLDLPEMGKVGHALPADRLLVNRGTMGSLCFSNSQGVVVNVGEIGRVNGSDCNGVIINAGKTKVPAFSNLNGGLLIALHDMQEIDDRVRTYGQLSGETREHLGELVELCRGPIERIHDRYGEVPALTIKKDLAKTEGSLQFRRLYGGSIWRS